MCFFPPLRLNWLLFVQRGRYRILRFIRASLRMFRSSNSQQFEAHHNQSVFGHNACFTFFSFGDYIAEWQVNSYGIDRYAIHSKLIARFTVYTDRCIHKFHFIEVNSIEENAILARRCSRHQLG